MKTQFFTTLLLSLFMSSFSQNKQENNVDEYRNKGYFNITRFSYIKVNEAKLETFSTTNGIVVTELPINRATAYSLQTINGYFFSPYFSAGIGIGLDGYSNPNFNTLPIFLDLRTYFNDGKSSPYLYTNYGTLVKIEGGKNNGAIFNIGVGFKFPLNKNRFIMVTDISYSYKTISNDGLSIRRSESWTQIKGTMLSLGILF
ncbi:hypothetical protein FEZ18_02420 [Oceanihabitans sp. IOP_32]|uniref:hypothetical protein n=1 Tax=Oceanihabitans sp. IOP_32 TaxID=2529032 RepID=UPI001292E22B|nr:hypothetical protein [Oceanihabitans sp. IOP_32]QFZ53741.1 hypothetical protein FEZ18_02420 [Oceanihabitans sp. IOP_32]